ncbi:MAG TPA: response regulator [Candidatus Binatia bacterium]
MTSQEHTAERHEGRRILLVDDEESVLFAMQQYFQLRGHEVHRAADADSAQRLLDELSFAWVVTDLHLTPAREGNGIEVARKARNVGVERVVLLTAHRTVAIDQEAALAGIDRVIAKPVRLPELEALLAGAEPVQ